jgi:hypothetical protein
MPRILEHYYLGDGPWWFAAPGPGAGERAPLALRLDTCGTLEDACPLSQTSQFQRRNPGDSDMGVRQRANVA